MRVLGRIRWLTLVAAAVVLAAVKTGPAVGEKIPAFEVRDIEGNLRDFENLKGPNGLVLLFVRSADW